MGSPDNRSCSIASCIVHNAGALRFWFPPPTGTNIVLANMTDANNCLARAVETERGTRFWTFQRPGPRPEEQEGTNILGDSRNWHWSRAELSQSALGPKASDPTAAPSPRGYVSSRRLRRLPESLLAWSPGVRDGWWGDPYWVHVYWTRSDPRPCARCRRRTSRAICYAMLCAMLRAVGPKGRPLCAVYSSMQRRSSSACTNQRLGRWARLQSIRNAHMVQEERSSNKASRTSIHCTPTPTERANERKGKEEVW